MTYEELSKLLCFDEKENNIYMPNEIFADLNTNLKDISLHKSFAYSYVYLTTWLYRYTKYANASVLLDQTKLKEILGYVKTNKTLDYIIKKNGILEQIKYLETTTDYPISWSYKEGEYDEYGISGLNFDKLSDYKNEERHGLNKGKNFKVKYPVRAFTRYINDEEMVTEEYNSGYLDGTFYEVENTHLVPFEIFMYCLGKDDIGTIGFYIWSYLKMKNQIFRSGYDVSVIDLSDSTGIKLRTLTRYLDAMRKYLMIKVEYNQDYFVYGMEKGERKVNTYKTNDEWYFADEHKDYQKIRHMKYDKYVNMKNLKCELDSSGEIF